MNIIKKSTKRVLNVLGKLKPITYNLMTFGRCRLHQFIVKGTISSTPPELREFSDGLIKVQNDARNNFINTLSGLDQRFEVNPSVSVIAQATGDRGPFIAMFQHVYSKDSELNFRYHSKIVEALVWHRDGCNEIRQ